LQSGFIQRWLLRLWFTALATNGAGVGCSALLGLPVRPLIAIL